MIPDGIFADLRSHIDDRMVLCCRLKNGQVMCRSGVLKLVHRNAVLERESGRLWRIPVSAVVSIRVLEAVEEEEEKEG